MIKNYIHLAGYFDRNFGDDMMMKLIVRSLPEMTFWVEDTVNMPIPSEPNVEQKDRKTCALVPKLVVTGSGFMINTKGAFITEFVWLLNGHRPGDYCLGCNIEPLKNPIKWFLINRKVNKFKLITCRDQASYRWLRWNARKPQVHYLPDILFSLPDEWLPKAQFPNKLGISIMHRAGDQEDCAYYRAMAEIADEWVRNTGKGVILMAFDTGREDDLFACHGVKSLMEFSDHAEIVAHRDCTEIPAAFAQCEKIIAGRFHASVLALRMGVQLYPLIFRQKTRNLLKDLQFPYPSCHMDNIDKASLQKFINSDQEPYHVEEDLRARAALHAQLLKQMLAQ